MSRSTHDARPFARTVEPPLTLAGVLELFSDSPLQFRFTAFDGSSTGPADAEIGFHVRNTRGAAYIATSPGSLGLARAYVAGDLLVSGVHPGDPYAALRVLGQSLHWRRPQPRELRRIATTLGMRNLVPPPPPPPQEAAPDWRRLLSGRRHSRPRDSDAISHHYDVSNRFYELLLGPSMTYTCSCYPRADATLEEAQAYKYELVARKLALRPGQRLLDVGCGWGGMVMHAAREHGVHALGVTLSQQQASWAQTEIKRHGLDHLAEVRHLDYREVRETGFDAISSIGLTEHIGVRNYPSYFTFLRNHLRPGGRLLNHCITRPNNRQRARAGGFIDRYVFPDGELTGSGTIITTMQDVGFEVRHEENLREHYARTCAAWCANLVAHWDECVAEVGEETAKIWGLYLAGSRLGFEQNEIQLHQVLGVRVHHDGRADWPLRPDWE
ncbi:MAG: class I SAM-dependent methyltransferase [Actinomycetota bacterium]|nr:class I SAM-dependent methyltransferase [Actinomycetota bacterium]